MRETAMSRRTLLGAGACTLAAAAIIPEITGAHAAATALSPKNEALVRKWYTQWGTTTDWHPFDILLADDFTFTSPLDDHISKSAFKKRCWDTQNTLIKQIDLKQVVGTGADAFVLYVGQTTKDKTFRNVEYVQLKGDRLQAIECYFGAQDNFPSAVNGKK